MDVSNILYGGDVDLDIDNNVSYGEFLINQMLANDLSKKAVIDGVTEEFLTYDQFYKECIRTYHILKNLRIKYGDRISICCENRLEFHTITIGAMLLGAIVAPMNFSYQTSEMKHCMNISQPKIIFCSKLTLDGIIKVKKDCGYLRTVVSLDERPKNAPHFVLAHSALKQSVGNLKTNGFPKFNNESTALILYSSGTTGMPKGVMLTHRNLIINHLITTLPEYTMVEDNEALVSFLPMFHAYGCLVTLILLGINSTAVLLAKFDLEKYCQLLEKYRSTICFTVPPICVLLAKSPVVKKYDLSNLKMMVSGAAPLSKSLANEVSKRLNIPPIRQGYGMTETTLGVVRWTNASIHDISTVNNMGSIGKLCPRMYGKVVDVVTGETLPANKEGELCFKGPLIMKGYYKNREETVKTIDEDGWLHTGDIGYYDKDGWFYIVDRLKELIKVKGFQVAPAELEAVLLENPKIKDVGIIGIPDEKNGEIPFAFVVKQPGVNLSEKEVQSYIEERLVQYKHLKGGVRFVEEIPKNPSGKILRRKLREILKNKAKL